MIFGLQVNALLTSRRSVQKAQVINSMIIYCQKLITIYNNPYGLNLTSGLSDSVNLELLKGHMICGIWPEQGDASTVRGRVRVKPAQK